MNTKQKWKELLLGMMMCLVLGAFLGPMEAKASEDTANEEGLIPITSIKFTVPEPITGQPIVMDFSDIQMETVPADAVNLITARWSDGYVERQICTKKKYHPEIWIEPKEGYTLENYKTLVNDPSLQSVTINGTPVYNMTYDRLDGIGICRKIGGAIYYLAQDIPLTEIHITGVNPAVAGHYCGPTDIKIETVPKNVVQAEWNYSCYDYTDLKNRTKYDVFQYGHEYVQYINLYPREGVEVKYSALKNVTVNGEAGSITISDESIAVRMNRIEVAAATTVHRVDVEDFSEPKEGEKIARSLQFSPAGDAYSDVISKKWWDSVDYRYIGEDEYFKPGHNYRLDVVLNVKEGGTYGYMPTCSINNNQNLVDTDTLVCTETEIRFSTYEYNLPVSKIELKGYKPPVAGQTVEENLKDIYLTENSCSVFRQLSWWDDRNQTYMKSTGTFRPGRTYRLEVTLEPHGETYYKQSLPVLINGGTTLLDEYTLARETRNVEFATKRVTVEPLATPVLVSVENGEVEGEFGVKLTWNPVENASYYGVLRLNADGTIQEMIDRTDKTTYLDTNVTDGSTYIYSVFCLIPNTSTFISDYDQTGLTITYKKLAYPSPAPKLKQLIRLGKVTVEFTWEPYIWGEWIYKYEVLRKEGDGEWKRLGVVKYPVYDDNGTEKGKTYTYTVRRVDEDGITPLSTYDQNGLTIEITDGPVISTQPQSVTAAEGTNATFKIVATGTGLSYQWQYSQNNGSTWINSGAASSVTDTYVLGAKASRNGYLIRCKVTDANKKTVTSNAVKLTVTAGPVITTQPKAVTAVEGTNATFKIVATGSGLSYQWQYSQDNGTTWKNSSAASSVTDTYVLGAKASRNGYLIRCIVKDANGKSVTSSAVKLTVTAAGPVITTQPKAVTAVEGTNATFKVVATGSGLSYQWQYSQDNGTTWKNSSAASSVTDTYVLGAKASRNGYLIRCIVKDANGKSVTSSAVKLTVTAAGPVITTQPKAVTAVEGTNATFKIVATGTGLSYQWQYSQDNGTTWKNSSAASSVTDTYVLGAKASRNGYLIRCKVTDANKKTVTSNAVKLTVTAGPVITTQPKAVTAVEGTNATFKIVATGSGLSYQWQYSQDKGTTWKDSGAASSVTDTYVLGAKASRNGYLIRCIVKDANGKTVISDAVKLTVK